MLKLYAKTKVLRVIKAIRCRLRAISRGMNVSKRKGFKMNLVQTLSEQYMKPELPEMNVGDTVRVTVLVKEGNRERTQAFDGTIIAKKHGGINESITVRRISYGVGVEKTFPALFAVYNNKYDLNGSK